MGQGAVTNLCTFVWEDTDYRKVNFPDVVYQLKLMEALYSFQHVSDIKTRSTQQQERFTKAWNFHVKL